jgi:hypothetical protein
MASIINPRDIQLQAASTRLVGVSLPPNVVVDPDNVDGLGLILDGIKRVWISATSQIFQIAKDGDISPTSITLTANIRNLTGTPTLTIVPGSGTMSVVPALTAGIFTFTPAQLTSDTITLRLSLTESSVTYSDDFTFVKVREGADSINGLLTNESHTVSADSAGNVLNYNGASGTFKLWLGTLDIRTVSTFAVASGGNPDGLTVAITASGSNAGNYTVTGGFPSNKDTVTITFEATFGTTVVPKVLTLTKSKAGTNGTNGVRGSRSFYYALGGSTNTWSDVIATTTASVDGGPILNDQVTEYNNSMDFSQTKFWNGSTWVNVDAVIDGNLLVKGTVGASKVVVNAGAGTNVWFDPNYADSTAWQTLTGGEPLPQRVTITDGAISGTVMRSSTGVQASARGAFRTPVVVGNKYRVSIKARKSSTANGPLYVRLDIGTSRTGTYSNTSIGIENITAVNTSWQEFSVIWTATAPYASPAVYLNDGGTAGYMEAQDIRIEEMNAAGLVVQGGIIADQIDSRGLSIRDALGNIILAAGTQLPISYAATGTVNDDLVPSITAAAKSAAEAANLINLDFWRKGGSIAWGTNGESNQLISVESASWPYFGGPKGGSDCVWYCVEATGDGDSGGGWNNAPFAVPLDPTKTYRFVVPIRRIGGTGTSYWGVANVCDLNTTTINGNPYFASMGNIPTDRWYLFVGYVYPFGSTGNSHDSSGIWDCKTGLKVQGGYNFNHAPAGVASHRAYQYYASASAEQVFGRPCVNVIDGTEPSLRDYFEPSAILNDVLIPSITAAANAASAASTAASNAQTSANAANTAIANISSDNVLSRGEKPQAIQDWLAVSNERTGIVAQANAYSIVTERNAYTTAHDALNTYLSGLSPAYSDTTTDTPIVGTTYRATWVSLYDARQALLNKIAEVAGQRAVWASVSGSGRPADNATVGATIGVNLSGQIDSGNVSTYIANAAIGSAQIGTINANQVNAASLSAITATIGTLRTATTGARTEIKDNLIEVYDSSNILRIRLGVW